MKYSIFTWIILVAFSTSTYCQFKTGEKVSIDQTYDGDLYVAGGTININKPVLGDLVAAGGMLNIDDSIHQDLLIAGGQISVFGPVRDDIRCAGGNIRIRSSVGDDLLVFGGTTRIDDNAVINGDLLIFGGRIEMYGLVRGSVKAYGGEIFLNGIVENDVELKGGRIAVNGTVNGSGTIAAEILTIGNNALIKGDLDYWSEKGKLDIPEGTVGGTVTYNPQLSFDGEETFASVGPLAVTLVILYLIAVFCLILVIHLVFKKQLVQVSAGLVAQTGEKLGYGFLYLFGVPAAIVILMAIVVGIPIGLFLTFGYLFSLLFGYPVASLLYIHYLNQRRTKELSTFLTVLLALGVTVGLRVVTFIPFIGWLICLLVMAFTYGSIIYFYRKRSAM